MFKIGEKVVNKSGKVCEVVDIESKDYGVGLKTYYVLCPCFTANPSLRIFTPTDQEDTLRRTMNKEEVELLLEKIPSIETIWYTNPKVRKTKFKELYTTGDPIEIFRLIKSFEKKKEEFKEIKKNLSFTDENFLKEIRTNIYYEIGVALKLNYDEVEEFLLERLSA